MMRAVSAFAAPGSSTASRLFRSARRRRLQVSGIGSDPGQEYSRIVGLFELGLFQFILGNKRDQGPTSGTGRGRGMQVAYEPWLVLLSIVMAIQGAYVGFTLAVQLGAAVGIR